MTGPMAEDLRESQQADPGWFRQPTKREHRFGGWLFLGFAVFFAVSFFVLSGWWMRWVMLSLGACSAVRGIYHLVRASMASEEQ